jgi:lipopolysaccharide export system permease protein
MVILTALLMIFMTIYFLERISWFSEGQTGFFLIAQYFLLTLPKTITDLMPLALFLSSLLTVSLLSKNNELIPMMGSGMSIAAITAPMLVFGMGIGFIFFFLNGSFVPATYKAARIVQKEKIEKRGMGGTFIQNKIWIRLNGRVLLTTKLIDAENNKWVGVHFYYLGQKQPLDKEIEAETLHFEKDQWVLLNGVQIVYQKDGTTLRIPFVRQEVHIEKTVLDLQHIEVAPDEMTYEQLHAYIHQLEKDGLKSTRYQVDLDRKQAFSLSNFIVVLLGITIAFLYAGQKQKAISKSVLVGLAIFLLYWLSLSVFVSLGKTGQLSPLQAGFLPHILFLFFGGWQFLRLHQTIRL